MFTLNNVYLGRAAFLVSVHDLYTVANTIAVQNKAPAINEKAFTNKVTAALSRWLLAGGGYPVHYLYDEASDTHYTNIHGVLAVASICPPNYRMEFLAALQPALTLPEFNLDQPRKVLAVDQIKINESRLLSEEVAREIIGNPEKRAELLRTYNTTGTEDGDTIEVNVIAPLAKMDDARKEDRGTEEAEDSGS